jgi:hypothetical protein
MILENGKYSLRTLSLSYKFCIDISFFFCPSEKIKIFISLRSLDCYIGCSFKCLLKVGVKESIVNAPFVSLQSKNTNNAKSGVRFKQLIRDLQSVVRSQSTLQRLL